MQCKPAAGNRGPMFLQLYPSYVDAHEDIAIASNWEQIHVCLQQLFLSKCVWEWIIYLLHVTLTYPHKTPNMPFISIHRHMLVKISKCYRDFFWGRTSLYPLKILWASILPFLALFDPPYNLLLPIVFPDLSCVTGTSSGSTTHNKGIRDAGSTADFRILFEIFEILEILIFLKLLNFLIFLNFLWNFWNFHTFTLSHFHTVTLSHFHTFALSHFRTFTLSHFHTFTLLHFHTFALSDFRTFRLSHFQTFALSHFHTLTLSHFCTFRLSHFHTFTLSHVHTFTLSHFHTFTLSHFHTLKVLKVLKVLKDLKVLKVLKVLKDLKVLKILKVLKVFESCKISQSWYLLWSDLVYIDLLWSTRAVSDHYRKA